MNCYLSKNEISSFLGDVVCLKLKSDENIERADISWSTDSDAVEIREFRGDFSFNDGVLLVLRRVGTANVCATLDGVEYSCHVTVNERQIASPTDKFNYYVGDLHDHTTMEHGDQAFYYRTESFPCDLIRKTQEDGRLDFTVVTDHGSIMYDKNFFQGFIETDECDNGELIVLPGSESEVSFLTKNIYGLSEVLCGEFVLLNASGYCFVDSFEKAEKIIARDPLPIVSIVHPQDTWNMKGQCIGGIDLTAERGEAWRNAVKLVEIGRGLDRGVIMLFEYSYSQALDNGYKVSPVSTSDYHGPNWGFDAWPGKTVILAPRKTKEHIIDAIYNNRVYATECGATKLHYTVNGYMMGSDIPLTNKYDFHVEIGSLRDDCDVKTVRCEVISDYRNKVKVIEGVDFSSFDFTIESDSARYFYLRIIHEDETKTYSAPVFLGRKYDEHLNCSDLTRLDKSGVSVAYASSEGADALLNCDIRTPWYTGSDSAEVVFDMGEVTELTALRLWEHYFGKSDLEKQNELGIEFTAQFLAEHLSEFRISLSLDGENYVTVAERCMQKTYDGFYARFPRQSARYVKLELLSSMGKESGRSKRKNAKIKLGEVDFYN